MSKTSQTAVTQVTSTGSILEPDDHQIDIHAITSHRYGLSDVAEGFSEEEQFFVLKRLNYEGLESLDDLPPTATFMFEKIQSLDVEQSMQILEDFLVAHENDVNVLTQDYQLVEALVEKQNQGIIKEKLGILFLGNKLSSHDLHELFDVPFQARVEAAIIAYFSPYSEVRSVTEPFDDPTIPVETVRVYILGIVWTVLGSVVNQFFLDRQPSITLTGSVVQLFLYPCGLLLQWILPTTHWKIGKYVLNLNPGPYNYKEQMLATIMFVAAGSGTSYATSNITVQRLDIFYGNKWATWGYQVLLTLSTNFMGFGLAGIVRRFAVYPVQAMWPTLLPTIALNKALLVPEKKERINGWTISRYAWFFAVTAYSFVWFWVPDYLFQALSTFNWITWIKPDNINLSNITGSFNGLGMNPIPSFDWNIINNGCFTVPVYTTVLNFIGMIIGFFAIVGVFYSNYKWTAFIPINSNHIFDNKGQEYDVTRVVNENSLFDRKKYDAYSPPFYSAANLVVYGAFFALYPFAFVYEFGCRYKVVWLALKDVVRLFKLRKFNSSSYDGFNDPHSTMMKQYEEVPEWYFLVVLVISIVLAILCVKLYPAETPVWGIFFTVAINFVFLIPMLSVYARTGFSFGLNVLVELIIGYALPGNGLGLMTLKALGYNIDGQAENYISSQKLVHYAKIPPRSFFRCQVLGILVATFIDLAMVNYAIDNIKDYCQPNQPEKFSCPGSNTFFSASVIWGVIGPKKIFGGLYPILQYCFLIGFLLALVCLAIKFYLPKKYVKYFEPTIIMGGVLGYAPYNLTYYVGGLYIAIAFMWYLKSRYTSWWIKYNYVLVSGLTAGIAFSSIIIFFGVQYHEKDVNWWGNIVPYSGLDFATVGMLDPKESAPDGYFGPRKGDYP